MPRNTLTQAQAAKAALWAQRALGLEDWTLSVHVGDDRPEWAECPTDEASAGINCYDPAFKRAGIWVSPGRCSRCGWDPRHTLFHEIVHVSMEEAGLPQESQGPPTEFVIDRIAALMNQAYRP